VPELTWALDRGQFLGSRVLSEPMAALAETLLE
jgi:hypothetical protein